MTNWADIWPESVDSETGEDASQPWDGERGSDWPYPDDDSDKTDEEA